MPRIPGDPGGGPAPKPRRRARVRPKPKPVQQTAAAAENERGRARRGGAPVRRAPVRPAAPKYKPTPTPDTADHSRPSEPVKVTVRRRHGAKVERETHTLPNVAAVQAHLDRVQHARERRAELRGENRDTGRSEHPKVIVIPKPGEDFDHAQRGAAAAQREHDAAVEAADRKVRVRVRAETRAQRAKDDRDVALVGAARGPRGASRSFDRAVRREAEKSAPEIVRAARHLSRSEQREFHGEAVKAAGKPNAPEVRGSLKTEADRREKARKAAKGDPGDVLGNARREVVDTLVGLPAAVAEVAKAGAEQLDTSGRTAKPHSKALVKGLKATPAGELAQGHVKKAARAAAMSPVSTALSVAAGAGTLAKGASVASTTAKIVKAGEHAPRRVHAAVRAAEAAKRTRQNATVDTKARKSTKKKTRAERADLRSGKGTHRRGDVATKAQHYSSNPIIRTIQKGREDRVAGKGRDPHQKRGRKARRIVKRDAGRRVDIVQAAGHVRQHEVDAAVDDQLAREHGAKGTVKRAKVRRAEKRALRQGGKGTGRHLFAAMQAGIVKDSDTLAAHIRVHEHALETGKVDGHELTADERTAVTANLRRLRDAETRGLVHDPDLQSATEQRRKVGEGQDRRRAGRLRGGRARMKARDEKVMREGRGEPPAPARSAAADRAAVPSKPVADQPAAAARPAADRTIKVTATRSGTDPGFQFRSGESTKDLREQHADAEAQIERLNRDIDAGLAEVDPKTRAALRKQPTRAERRANAGKSKRDPAYVHTPHERHRRKQYGRAKALEDQTARRDALAAQIAEREAHLRANPDKVERGSPQRGRPRTKERIAEINAAKADVDRLQGMHAHRESFRDASTARADALAEHERTLRAHRRHGHLVLGHAEHADDAGVFDYEKWGSRTKHEDLIKARADFEKWTGEKAPIRPAEAHAIAAAAQRLQERRRAGHTAGPRTGGRGDVVRQSRAIEKHQRSQRAIDGRIAQAEADLERIEGSRMRSDEWARERHELETELEDLKAQRSDSPGELFDLSDLSDDELAGLRRAGTKLGDELTFFARQQQGRLTRSRKAKERYDAFTKITDASHVHELPDDLDAQLAAARSRYQAALDADKPEQIHARDAQLRDVEAQIRDELTGQSATGETPGEAMFGDDPEFGDGPRVREPSLEDERRGNVGTARAVPTVSLKARRRELTSDRVQDALDPANKIRVKAAGGAPGGKDAAPRLADTQGTPAPIADRGGYVPTSRELHGEPDSRLGVSEIRGRWSKKDLLSEDWAKYDPARVQGRLERGISAAELNEEVLKSARGRDLSAAQADARVAELNAGSGIKWARVEQRTPAQIGRELIDEHGGVKEALKATHPDAGGDAEDFDAVRAAQQHGDDEPPAAYAVVPKGVAERFDAARRTHGLFGRSLRYANARFVRAVLPLAATWHAGNALDMVTRLALTGARPGDAALARQLRDVLAGHDEEWARLALDSVGGAHFRGQSTRDAPLHKHIPLLDDALDQLFAGGRALEAKAARSAQGSALRAQARALGQDAQDVKTLVAEWRRRPELVEDFQARTLEIIGDYVHHPLLGSHDMRVAAPFIQWIKASLRFTFATLPAKHPIRTALMFNLAAATDEQRRLLGQSNRITDEQAAAIGLPHPHEGFLAGGLNVAGGILPTANLTSFGAAAGILEDPLQWAGNILFPWANSAAGRVAGTRDSGLEYGGRIAVRRARGADHVIAPGSGRDTGDPGSVRAVGEGLSSLGESFLPGVKQAGQVRRGGRRPGVHTTAVGSIVHGGAKTKPDATGKTRFKDGSSGKTHGAIRVLSGTAVQKDFPAKPTRKTERAGAVVQVKALDGSVYWLDTRSGRQVAGP